MVTFNLAQRFRCIRLVVFFFAALQTVFLLLRPQRFHQLFIMLLGERPALLCAWKWIMMKIIITITLAVTEKMPRSKSFVTGIQVQAFLDICLKFSLSRLPTLSGASGCISEAFLQ